MRRLVVVVLTVLAVVVATAGSAAAQTKVRQDPAGDGPRAADVRSLRVANGADRLVVTVKLQRVIKRRSAVFVGVAQGLEEGDDPAVLVDVYAVAGGRFKARALLTTATTDGDFTVARLRCAERDVDVRRGRGGLVRVAIDRTCIPLLSNRLETAAVAYDKGRLGLSISQTFLELEALGRGDVPDADDSPDVEDLLDETSFVTTRRG